jgi:hypothetical protein
VPSFRIAEPLDVIKDIGSCFVARPVSASTDSILLHPREEALHNRIVVALARTVHAVFDAVVGQQLLELLTSILASLDSLMFVKWR